MVQAVGRESRSRLPAKKASAKSAAAQSFEATLMEDLEETIEEEDDPQMRALLEQSVGRIRGPQSRDDVHASYLLRYIKEQRKQNKYIWKLPWTISFFVTFVVMVLLHEDIASTGLLERHVRGMLEGTSFEGVSASSGHKFMDDIASVEDIWLYLREAVLPTFLTPTGTATEDINRVLRYNRLIGGIQLQQRRKRGMSCSELHSDQGPFMSNGLNPLLTGVRCFTDTMVDDCFGPLQFGKDGDRRALPPGFCADDSEEGLHKRGDGLRFNISSMLKADVAPPRRLVRGGRAKAKGVGAKGAASVLMGDRGEGGTFSTYFYEHKGLDAGIAHLDWLQEHGWIDLQTASVAVRMYILNPDLGAYLHVTINIVNLESGEVLPYLSAQSFIAEPYQNMALIAADVIFLLLLLQITVNSAVEIVYSILFGQFRRYFKDVWHWIHMLTALCGFSIVALWITAVTKFDAVKILSLQLAESQEKLVQGEVALEYPERLETLHIELNSLESFLMVYRMVVSYYTLFIISRFFESFQAQPRLAMVTKTLVLCATDLIHNMIIIMLCWFGYAVAGMFIFGRRMYNFSSFEMSVNTCFLVMLGDFDWEELSQEHPLTAALWFWTFGIFVSIIQLNMVMAVIMDVYIGEVKAAALSTEPIWTQAWIMANEYSITKEWVSLSVLEHVVYKLLNHHNLQKVDEGILLQLIPGMALEQSKTLVQGARNQMEEEEAKGMKISDACRLTGWIHVATKKMEEQLKELILDMYEEQVESMHFMEEQKTVLEKKKESEKEVKEEPPGVLPCSQFDRRIGRIMQRMEKLEKLMEDCLAWTNYRGKDAKDTLTSIEALLKADLQDGEDLSPREWELPPGDNDEFEAKQWPAMDQSDAQSSYL